MPLQILILMILISIVAASIAGTFDKLKLMLFFAVAALVLFIWPIIGEFTRPYINPTKLQVYKTENVNFVILPSKKIHQIDYDCKEVLLETQSMTSLGVVYYETPHIRITKVR